MSYISKTYNYNIPTDYTYDSNKIEFINGKAQLKNQQDTTATSGATYTTDINLNNWSNGTLIGTAVGGASITNNRLDLAQSDIRYVDYTATNNADSQQVGAIKFKLTPNYTGAPNLELMFFYIGKENGDLKNSIHIKSQTNGDLYLFMFDEDGLGITGVYNVWLANWSPTAGTTYEFELNWDLINGETRLFIDGTQFGTTKMGTGTRDSNIGLLRIGSNYSGVYKSNFYIEDLIYYPTVQHTTDYTAGYTLPETIYVTDNPTIVINDTINIDGLSNFTETVEITEGDSAVKYILSKDGQAYYHNGSLWVTSDGTYNQTNTASEILSNASTFTNSDIELTITVFLNSDGTEQCAIDNLVVTYDFASGGIESINKCIVYGYLVDFKGNLVTDTINIRLYNAANTYKNNIIVKDINVDILALEGYFEVELIETENMPSGSYYTFTVNGLTYNKAVPNENFKSFNELVDA